MWTESAGYFALDGSLEMPEAIFNALARFPTQDHNALTNSSLDCTWVLYPKYNGTTLFHHFCFIPILIYSLLLLIIQNNNNNNNNNNK